MNARTEYKRDGHHFSVKIVSDEKEHWVQRLEDCFDERGQFICCECDCK